MDSTRGIYAEEALRAQHLDEMKDEVKNEIAEDAPEPHYTAVFHFPSRPYKRPRVRRAIRHWKRKRMVARTKEFKCANCVRIMLGLYCSCCLPTLSGPWGVYVEQGMRLELEADARQAVCGRGV